jgi:hypothetical protein
MNLQSFMQHLVNLQPAYRQADFKVSITTNQKPFEQPTQKAFLRENTEGVFHFTKQRRLKAYRNKKYFPILAKKIKTLAQSAYILSYTLIFN